MCDPIVYTRSISERFIRDKGLIIKRYINSSSLPILCFTKFENVKLQSRLETCRLEYCFFSFSCIGFYHPTPTIIGEA